MVNFQLMNKNEFCFYQYSLFYILSDNMAAIAPTGNTYDQDFKLWAESLNQNLGCDNRQIILIFVNSKLAGFFMYSIEQKTLKMEEIQFKHEYQHENNLFHLLYSYLFTILPEGLEYTDAYANKKNIKSQAILEHIGLKRVSENNNHIHYQGRYADLINWFNKSHIFSITGQE